VTREDAGRSHARAVDGTTTAVLALVMLGPVLLHRGYVLSGDMVFVPDQPWKRAWLGLDGQVPRFVPGDAFLAAAGAVVPGDLVQKGVLLLALVVAGLGAGRLVAQHGGVARVAAITFFLWNPWVYERLAIGQWGVVVGYALLPWIVLSAGRVRDGDRRGWPALVGWLGLAAVFSPASGLVAVTVTLAVLVIRARWTDLGVAILAGAAVNLPWILPGLMAAESMQVPPAQFTAFGAHAESSLGVVASVLSLGGIWKTTAVPGERTSEVVVAFSLLLTAVALAGLWLEARSDRVRVLGLGLAAGLAILLALLASLPTVATGMEELAGAMPALGLLRDGHRYLGPTALALVPGVAAAVDWLWQRAARQQEGLRWVALLVLVAPILALPSLAWGLGGRWHPVQYPSEWFAVRQLLPEGRTVVLPWAGGYRGFPWNSHRAVLDPAPRFYPGDVLIDDRLLVGGRELRSEDPLLQAVRRGLTSDDPVRELRQLGVRNVLHEKGNGGGPPSLPDATVRHDGPSLTLFELGPAGDSPERMSARRQRIVVTADSAVLLGWLAAAGLGMGWAMRETRHRCVVSPCR